jgi:hypothetical protein
MKRLFILSITFVLTLPAAAAMTYDFRIVTEGPGGSEIAGKAAVDGENSRLDFTSGDNLIFRDNSVVISNDGGETLMVLDSKKKEYYELPLDEMFGALGSMLKAVGPLVKISITNPKVTVREAGPGGTIEGMTTKKYLTDMSYDMNMRVMGMNNSSSITSQTESWVTEQLSGAMTFIQQKNLRTGMEDIDELIKAQTTSMTGFPLKAVTTSTSTAKNGKSTTTKSTMTITNVVRSATVPAEKFKIPAGYDEVDTPAIGMPVQ